MGLPNVKINVLVPNKMQHQVRFVPIKPEVEEEIAVEQEVEQKDEQEASAEDLEDAEIPEENLLPGTVIDTAVVHSNWNEFYLNAHHAIKGTCRTPRYTILWNESEWSMDDFQIVTNNLCYGHQIVYSPTSLPSPVYIAMRYAERGRLLASEWWIKEAEDNQQMTYYDVECILDYFYTERFSDRRINA